MPEVILCVDDDVSVLRALRSLIGNLGIKCKVLIAESGLEALSIQNDIINSGGDIAVVISDCIMPGMKGDELLIKMHEVSSSTIKVMLTGQSDIACVKRAINKANLFRYIDKPFSNDELLLTVRTAVSSYLAQKNFLLEVENLKKKNSELQIEVNNLRKQLGMEIVLDSNSEVVT